MSQRTLHKCDVCGHEGEDKNEDKFETLSFSLGSRYGTFAHHSKFEFQRDGSFELCDKCLEKLGIKRKEPKAAALPKGAPDQLYDLLYDIVADCLSNQQQ